jgi:DNA polymerase (family 10)
VTTARPLLLGRAWDLLDRCVASIRSASSTIQAVEPAGGIRLAESLISSLTLVVRADDAEEALDAILSATDIANVSRRSDRHIAGRYQQAEIDIHVALPHEHGSVLFHATGSPEHVQQVLSRGVPDRPYSSEEELYASAGLAYVPPEVRHANGEVEAAASGRFPRLVDVSDIRGDLHMHTLFSDGRDPLVAMVEGCDALGYEYMAITDHSTGAGASRTLTRDSIARQRDEIDQMRERFPHMAIFHGCEVDILPDGRLDFEDSLLERFDLILASLHQRAGQDGARLTERSLQTIRHPLVNVLCHPANQLVGSTPPYPLDFEAIYRAAAETGTALEIDGAPGHLDLDGDHARAAAAAGATLTIDSDCHRVEALGRQMSFGTGLARRGWVEPSRVLNTRPLTEVRAFIAAKRSGRTSV